MAASFHMHRCTSWHKGSLSVAAGEGTTWFQTPRGGASRGQVHAPLHVWDAPGTPVLFRLHCSAAVPQPSSSAAAQHPNLRNGQKHCSRQTWHQATQHYVMGNWCSSCRWYTRNKNSGQAALPGTCMWPTQQALRSVQPPILCADSNQAALRGVHSPPDSYLLPPVLRAASASLTWAFLAA